MCCPIGRPWGTVVVERHYMPCVMLGEPGTLASIEKTEDGQCWALMEVCCTASMAVKIEDWQYDRLKKFAVSSSTRETDGSWVTKRNLENSLITRYGVENEGK